MSEPTKAALLASDMGQGKTSIAAEFLHRMDFHRVLIIGVKDTYAHWEHRLAAQSGGAIHLRRMDATKQGRQHFEAFLAGTPGHYFSGSQYLAAQDWQHSGVVNSNGTKVWKTDKVGAVVVRPGVEIGPRAVPVQETERRHLKTYSSMNPLDAIIVDEVHVFSNRDAIGLRTLKTIESVWRVGMSGTPYGNKFVGMWAITRWLWPDEIPRSFWVWSNEWCSTESYAAEDGRTVDNLTGERIPGTFVASLPCYIRSEAVMKPPPARIVYVDLLAQQRADYDSLEEEMLVWLQSHQGRAPLVAQTPITLRARLRTATLGVMSLDTNGEIFFGLDTQSTKLIELFKLLHLYGDQPVAIYTDSKRFAKVTAARLQAAGYNAAEWSGDVSSKQRDEIKQGFLDRKIQYLVAVIPAFSTGLDGFQTVCNKIVWLSESENHILNNQALARFFRPGRQGNFEHVKILARDTHDEGIYSRKIMETLLMSATLRAGPRHRLGDGVMTQ